MIFFTDADIASLVSEPKALKPGWRSRLKLKPKSNEAHGECDFELGAANERVFELKIRAARLDPMSFSVILCYRVPNSNRLFRLRRYNGLHRHTNRIESQTFTEFHIHEATERYQERGAKEEDFAVPTARYQDLATALDCCLADCNITDPDQPNRPLFPETCP
jgi:hypothetical protein